MKKSKAFSLFEISVIITIIAILMAGILQSKNIIRKAKINNARALTISSVVKDIDNLVLWYETTLEKSFIKDEAVNNSKISIWYDLNPNITTTSNNATQSNANNKPTYIEDGINGLPVLNFNRSNSNYLSFSGNLLKNSSFTVFVVERRTANFSNNYFIGGNETGDNANLVLGYKTNTSFNFGLTNNELAATVAAYSKPKAYLHSFTFNFVTKKYYLNGAEQTVTLSGSASNIASAISAFSQAYLGFNAASASYYNGDIGEVIIFAKLLTLEERKAVENYLTKKWNVS